MHPRQMRDTVIPVLPSLVNSMLSSLRVNYVSPGAQDRSLITRPITNYLSEAPEPKADTRSNSRYRKRLSTGRWLVTDTVKLARHTILFTSSNVQLG